MLQLLQPLWLIALTGIAVPVIIHFWNQRPGKTLKVGSTSLVIENAKEYRRSVKLSDILLLLLRCLLIATLALVLTVPIWKSPLIRSIQKGWILIPQQRLTEIYSHFKIQIDSLQNAGFEFHYFKENFPKKNLKEALAGNDDTTASKSYSYWTLLTLLDETLPRDVPAYLFTDNYLKHFSGKRPALSLSVHWSTFTPVDSTATHPVSQPHIADLNCTIFTDNYTTDAQYIKAAIDAIKSFSERNITCTIVTAINEIPIHSDWIFWLSDQQPVPDLHAQNIVVYKKGNVQKYSSVINMPETTVTPIRLYKSIPADSVNHSAEIKWTDGFGNAVLTKEEKDSVNYYRLFTHFDPSWNELVWNDNFPAIIYKLIANDNAIAGIDHRTIDQRQLLPSSMPYAAKKQNAKEFAETNLSGFLWLFLLLLFFAERFLSFQNAKLKING